MHQNDIKHIHVIPKRFVAKTALPQFSTIENFLDRRHCDSCWAFGIVESLSDWFCNLGNISLLFTKINFLNFSVVFFSCHHSWRRILMLLSYLLNMMILSILTAFNQL